MKILLKPFCLVLILTLFVMSCSSDEATNKDETKPTISINYTNGFPQACTELLRGQTYNFRAMVTDNAELAAYSLDIHHNFDHHTHDDQEAVCDLEPIKTSDNPLIFIENYSIEAGLTSYEINIELVIPNDVDTGDYHCAYSVTDITGWQARTSIDIKIVED